MYHQFQSKPGRVILSVKMVKFDVYSLYIILLLIVAAIILCKAERTDEKDLRL